MTRMKMLSTAAALALVAAMAAPTASSAEGKRFGGPAGGGAAFRAGGAPAVRMGGGAPAASFAARAPAMRQGGGVAWNGGHTAWNGGNGGAWRGGYRYRDRDGRFCAGFRTPGSREPPHDEVAGGRKAPRHEVAGSWARAKQRAL